MGVVVSAIVGSGTYLLLLLLPGLSEFQRAAIVPAWLMMGVLFGSYGSVGIVLSRTKTQSGRNWIKVYVITIICGLMWGGLWGLLLSPLYSFFPTAGMFVKQVALMFLPFGVAVIGTMAVYEFQKVAGKASP